jgi:hypothetical protein
MGVNTYRRVQQLLTCAGLPSSDDTGFGNRMTLKGWMNIQTPNSPDQCFSESSLGALWQQRWRPHGLLWHCLRTPNSELNGCYLLVKHWSPVLRGFQKGPPKRPFHITALKPWPPLVSRLPNSIATYVNTALYSQVRCFIHTDLSVASPDMARACSSTHSSDFHLLTNSARVPCTGV